MILRHVDVVTDQGIIKNCTLSIKEGKIHAIDKELAEEKNRWIVIPGFIDQHIHISSTHFKTAKETLFSHGVTSFLPTVATTSIKNMTTELRQLSRIIRKDDAALGIHLEGPFLNKEKAGAQSQEGLCFYDAGKLETLINASKNTIKILTFAPEMVTDAFYQSYPSILKQIGHSKASDEMFMSAYNHGIKTITHVFNALDSIHHRKESILLQSLLKEDIIYEL
ncbi:MAG: hypothetical protein ACOC1L_06955, partial [Bacillota bacterium]